MRKIIQISILVMLYSCANIGTLGGGVIDDKAPVLIKTNLTKTNFIGQEISLEFDEYVVSNSPEKNIILLPNHSTFKIKVHKKKVSIIFDSILQDQVTYNLIIKGGIVDNNAGNGFSYNTLFSRGQVIDSSKIKVKIENIKEYKDIKVALNKDDGNDSFAKFNSVYQQIPNTDELEYNGLKNIKYNLWVYTDKDQNNRPDLFEPISFVKDIKCDTNYNLSIKNWKKPFTILKGQRELSGQYIKIEYKREDNILEIPKKLSLDIQEFLILANTYSVIKYNEKSVSFLTDSIENFNLRMDVRNYIQESISLVKNKENYNLQYKQIGEQEKNLKNSHLNTIRRTFVNRPDTFIVTNNIIDYRDTFKINAINIKDEQKSALLNLSFNDTNQFKLYDIKILKDNKIYKSFYNSNQINEYLEPGVYKLEIYTQNSENIFEPIKMVNYPKPIYEKLLYLKASWEDNIVVKLP